MQIFKNKNLKILFQLDKSDPETSTFYKIATIDTGEIHYVNASKLKEIFASRKG